MFSQFQELDLLRFSQSREQWPYSQSRILLLNVGNVDEIKNFWRFWLLVLDLLLLVLFSRVQEHNRENSDIFYNSLCCLEDSDPVVDFQEF